MKNKIIPVILFCSLSFYSHSQFSAGIKAGGNFTNIMGPVKYKFKPGFHAGILMQYDFSDRFFLQPEVVYSVKGFVDKSSETIMNVTSSYNVKYNLSYLDIPLTFNITFGEMGSYVGIGPQFSLLLNANWDGEQTVSYPTGTTTTSTIAGSGTDGYNKTDFGAVFHFGSKFASGIEYCIRAGYGFMNVADPQLSTTSDVYHNLVFSLSLGYTFGENTGNGGGGGGGRGGHQYNKKRR